VLPHVLRFNAETAGHLYADIWAIVFPELAGLGSQARGAAFADALAGLAARCGLKPRRSDVVIPREAHDMMTDDTMKQTRLLVNDPRPLTRADAFAIYSAAW